MTQLWGGHMDVIAISKKKFRELEPLKLSKMVFNTEGIIYNFNYQGQPKILKTLFHNNGIIFANKLYTVEMLDTYQKYLPNSLCRPDSLVSVNGVIQGFTIPKLEADNLVDVLNDKNISPKEHIYYLKKVGELLDQLKSIRRYTPLNSIFLNDLHESNFLVDQNKKQLYVIDLDSCKIGTNVAFPSKFLTPKALLNNAPNKYKINNDEMNVPGYVTADENSDLYCYNIMILNYLYGDNLNNFNLQEFYEYLNYLEYIGVHRDLTSIFSRIVVGASNKNPSNYLDLLTNEQIYRAKSSVYTRVKK